MRTKYYQIILLTGIVFFVIRYIYFLSSDAHQPLPYVHSHNLRVIVPLRRHRIVSFPRDNQSSILLITTSDQQLSENAKLIISIVQSLRLPVYPLKAQLFASYISELIRSKSFRLVIFDDFLIYFSLPILSRLALDEYCKSNGVGVIGFLENAVTLKDIPANEDFSEVCFNLLPPSFSRV